MTLYLSRSQENSPTRSELPPRVKARTIYFGKNRLQLTRNFEQAWSAHLNSFPKKRKPINAVSKKTRSCVLILAQVLARKKFRNFLNIIT